MDGNRTLAFASTNSGFGLGILQSRLLSEILDQENTIEIRGKIYKERTNVLLELGTHHRQTISEIQHLEKLTPVLEKIVELAELFKEDPGTRRAYLYFPELEEGEPPCNLIYHFLLREARVFMNIYLRSSDVVNKLHSDVQTAFLCQRKMAELLNVEKGNVTFFIGSAHCEIEPLREKWARQEKRSKEIRKEVLKEARELE